MIDPDLIATESAQKSCGKGSHRRYDVAAKRSVRVAVRLDAGPVKPCAPHAWGCPVVMKLDPEHVAWTCAMCGAIAISDDPEVRPA